MFVIASLSDPMGEQRETIMPTRRRKPIVLAGIAALGACVAAIPFLPSIETLAAPYRGVARISLPNYTRVELPSTNAPTPATPGAGDEPLEAAGEAAGLAMEMPQSEASPLPSPAAKPTAVARTASGNIIPVKFDIETPGLGDEVVGGDEIVVRKAVRMGSREIGSLPIHVDARSRLLVRPSDLKSVLEKAGQGSRAAKAAASNELRSFGDLRKDGVDLRYDPNSDSVIVTIE